MIAALKLLPYERPFGDKLGVKCKYRGQMVMFMTFKSPQIKGY